MSETLIVIAIIVAAGAYLARRWFGTTTPSGCGCGCSGCGQASSCAPPKDKR